MVKDFLILMFFEQDAENPYEFTWFPEGPVFGQGNNQEIANSEFTTIRAISAKGAGTEFVAVVQTVTCFVEFRIPYFEMTCICIYEYV